MVPMQVFDSINTAESFARIRTLIIGGGEISPALLTRIKKLYNTRVYETFAMSETYSHFAVRRINGDSPDLYFQTLRGVKIGSDSRACLEVSVPGITNSPVQSNDLVEIVSEGSFKWLGRIDNRISSGGIKIIPELLEERLREKVNSDLVMVGIPDEKLGQKLVLVIEAPIKDQLPPDLKEWMQSNLQKHEIPKEIVVLPKLPRNDSMKILRRKLISFLELR
jgi:O-succinylbenzoic acid--CoA ligase